MSTARRPTPRLGLRSFSARPARARAFAVGVALGALSLFAPKQAQAEFPTLEVAIQKAREHALVVAEAEGELGVANAQLTGARVSALGNFYSEIQVDRPFSDGPRNAPPQVQVLTFNYLPVDIGGQRGKRIAEAEQLIGWKKKGLVNAMALATGDLVSAYGEIVISASRVSEASAGEVTAREEAKYFEGKFAAKDTTLYEKSIADAEVARWVQARAEAELRMAQSRARFMQLTGDSADKPPPTMNVLPPNLRGSWDDAQIAKAVDRAPLVANLIGEKQYWESSIERFEREKVPPVAFEIIAGRGGAGELRLGGGAVITLPTTRRYQGEIARAQHGRLHALRHLDLYRNVVRTRLVAAREAIASVQNALEELDKNGIPALERALQSAMEAFRAGKIDVTRAMLARRDLAIAKARRLDIIEAAWRAYSDLIIFSGELNP